MPLLGGLLSGLFAGLFSWFAAFLAKKTALAAAWVATFAALTAAMVAAVSAAAAAISVTVPGIPGFEMGVYGAAADIGLVSGGVCISVDALCAVYRWNVSNLTLLSRA